MMLSKFFRASKQTVFRLMIVCILVLAGNMVLQQKTGMWRFGGVITTFCVLTGIWGGCALLIQYAIERGMKGIGALRMLLFFLLLLMAILLMSQLILVSEKTVGAAKNQQRMPAVYPLSESTLETMKAISEFREQVKKAKSVMRGSIYLPENAPVFNPFTAADPINPGNKRPPQLPFRLDIVAQMHDVTADFILTPLHNVFSLQQLAWLQVHRHQLSDAVNAEIRGGSTLAIQMAVYLRLETAIGVLRERLLTLRSPYGWEGPDYSTEAPFLWDNQYPYHCIYIWAIQGIAQAPIQHVIKLTDAERDALKAKAAGARPNHSHPDRGLDDLADDEAWCAKWLLTHLAPQRKISD